MPGTAELARRYGVIREPGEPRMPGTTPNEKETAMPFSVGPMELVIVLVLALIILGPKRLPEAGKSLGRGIREFKNSIAGMGGKDEEDEPSAIPAPVRDG